MEFFCYKKFDAVLFDGNLTLLAQSNKMLPVYGHIPNELTIIKCSMECDYNLDIIFRENCTGMMNECMWMYVCVYVCACACAIVSTLRANVRRIAKWMRQILIRSEPNRVKSLHHGFIICLPTDRCWECSIFFSLSIYFDDLVDRWYDDATNFIDLITDCFIFALYIINGDECRLLWAIRLK